MKMKMFRTALLALCAVIALAIPDVAHAKTPRVLFLVTSADKFADGKPTGLWLEEFATPYTKLTAEGVKVTVVSPKGGVAPVDPRSAPKPAQAAKWKQARKALQTTVRLSPAVNALNYDAIFIPGGHGPLFDLATSPSAAKLISEFARSGKPVASVCHGPAALLGVTLSDGKPFLRGKKFTVFSDTEEKAAGLQAHVPFSVQQRLTALGGIYSKANNYTAYAVVDGRLITGQNPASSDKVAELLLHQLGK